MLHVPQWGAQNHNMVGPDGASSAMFWFAPVIRFTTSKSPRSIVPAAADGVDSAGAAWSTGGAGSADTSGLAAGTEVAASVTSGAESVGTGVFAGAVSVAGSASATGLGSVVAVGAASTGAAVATCKVS